MVGVERLVAESPEFGVPVPTGQLKSGDFNYDATPHGLMK